MTFEEKIAQLKRFSSGITAAVAKPLYQEGERIMAASKELVPVDTGNLRSTGHVEQPQVSESSVKIKLAYGGPAAPYALTVHEDPDAQHAAGKTYKYLQNPLYERSEQIKEAIKEGVRNAGK